jgi:hypothetical protein
VIRAGSLEEALLDLIHAQYAYLGFPEAQAFSVVDVIEDPAARRYVLEHPGVVDVVDCDLQRRYSYIMMEGLPYGTAFWAEVRDGKVVALFLLSAGDGLVDWTVKDAAWEIVDPETGAYDMQRWYPDGV